MKVAESSRSKPSLFKIESHYSELAVLSTFLVNKCLQYSPYINERMLQNAKDLNHQFKRISAVTQ